MIRTAKWHTDTQFNYQQPYQDAPVFTNMEVEDTGEDAFLRLSKKSNNDDDITYSDIADFTPSDPSKITVADAVAKLKSGVGIDINYPFTTPGNYDVSDATEIGVSGGYAKLLLPYLYALWKFNESSGSSASDSSGNGRTGTLYNMEDADWQSGKLSNALRFNEGATTNEYALFGNIAAFERTDSFSFVFWIKGTDATNYQTIFAKTPYGSWHGYEIFIVSGKINLYFIGSSEQINIQSSVVVNTGSWVMVAITYDGSSSHSGIKIYVDNVECSTGGSGTLTTSIVNTNNFQISGRGESNYNVLNDYMIDAFRIYTKELSAAEVSALYNSGTGTESLGYPTDHPYITNHTGVAFTAALTSFVETATKNNGTEIKYHISDDDGTTKYYWTGAAWAVSDGSYAQSSVATDIHANLSTWSSSGTFKWYAVLDSNGGIDTPLLDNIYVQSPSNYPTDDNLYIDTKDTSQIAPTDIFDWLTSTFTENVPANTYIAVLVSVDGRSTWLRWNGSAWVTSSSPTLRSEGNSISDYETNFTDLPLGNGTLDIRLFLKTDSVSVTPSVTSINVTSDAGYYTTGSYESTQYYPTGYFLGLLFKTITFDIETPSGTTLKVYTKFFPEDTIEDKESDYVEYDSGDDADFCDGSFIQWKIEATSDGEDTSQLNYIDFEFYSTIGLAKEINEKGLWY